MSFCKIHTNTVYGDALIMRGFDPELNQFIVSITIEYENFLVKASIDSKSEELMNEIYEGMDLERTEKTLNEILP